MRHESDAYLFILSAVEGDIYISRLILEDSGEMS